MGRVLPARSISRAALIGVATDFAWPVPYWKRAIERRGKLIWRYNLQTTRPSKTVAIDGISDPLTGPAVAEVGYVAKSLRRGSVTVVGAGSKAL